MPDRNSRSGDSAALQGLIVASFGRRYRVEVAGVGEFDCVTRGRRADLACGDRVRIAPSGPAQAVIEAADARSSLLYRSDAHREKLIAANVTQVVIVAAAVPPPHEALVNRCLVAAEHGGIAVAIVLNKADLPEHAAALDTLELYRRLGYPVLTLNAKRDIEPLRPRLQGHVSVLVGQSGAGKSTIINALVPLASARTGEISRVSGRHTTTHAHLYHIDRDSSIIDSPGMEVFGLHHVSLDALPEAFVEFRPYLGHCRFRDCRHLGEPGCAVEAAVKEARISERRLGAYRVLARERGTAERSSVQRPRK